MARGWCRRHYLRWKRTGQLEARSWKRQSTCSVDGCEEQSESGGYCQMHRWRIRHKGDPGPAAPIKKHARKQVQPCSVEGCDRPRKGATYCAMHYERVRRTGEPGPVQPLRVKGVINYTLKGYRRIHTGDGRRVMEHVHVMEQHLGRRLEEHENIHHRNGIRDDNRLANLELWVKVQPRGQRLEDLIQFVVEHYPEEVRRALGALSQLAMSPEGQPWSGLPFRLQEA